MNIYLQNYDLIEQTWFWVNFSCNFIHFQFAALQYIRISHKMAWAIFVLQIVQCFCSLNSGVEKLQEHWKFNENDGTTHLMRLETICVCVSLFHCGVARNPFQASCKYKKLSAFHEFIMRHQCRCHTIFNFVALFSLPLWNAYEYALKTPTLLGVEEQFKEFPVFSIFNKFRALD